MILHSSQTNNQADKDLQIGLDFAQIWLKCPSFNPIYKSRLDKSWLTMKAGDKSVPLLPEHIDIATYGNNEKLVGKRFGKFTNYLALDIDSGSEYHPLNGSLEDIQWALEEIGLCRSLTVQSSDSKGIHIYYPLEHPVSSWKLATDVYEKLTEHNIKIKNGTCELFPNKKAWNSDYNGHRLPLQAGSFILNDGFEPTTNSIAAFVSQWNAAAKGQDYVESPDDSKSGGAYIPVWDERGISNNQMMRIAHEGVKSGYKTIPELSAWVKKTATNAKGYKEFASESSKRDIEKGTWSTRVAKYALKRHSHFIHKSASNATDKPNHTYQDSVSESAKERLIQCIAKACSSMPELMSYGIKKIGLVLSSLSSNLFGQGFSNSTIFKYKEWILSQIKSLAVELEDKSDLDAVEDLESNIESDNVNDLFDESVELDSLESVEHDKGIHTVNNGKHDTRLTHQCLEQGTQPPHNELNNSIDSDSISKTNSESKISQFISTSAQIIQSATQSIKEALYSNSVALPTPDDSPLGEYIPPVLIPRFWTGSDDVVWIDPSGREYTLEGF